MKWNEMEIVDGIAVIWYIVPRFYFSSEWEFLILRELFCGIVSSDQKTSYIIDEF